MTILYILDADFTLIAVCDNFFSLMWTAKYQGPGSVEAHFPFDYYGALNAGRYIYRVDTGRTAIIEEIGWANGDLYAKGRTLEAILEGRIIPDFTSYAGRGGDVLRLMVARNAIADRPIAKLDLGAGGGSIGTDTSFQKRGATLLDACLQIATEQDIGFRVYYDFDHDKIFFEEYQGVDRRYAQDANSWIMFSAEWGNVTDEKYTLNRNSKNYAYVLGTGEEDDVFQIEVDQTNGAPRREMYVEARDIEYDSYTTRAEYAALLRERGLQILAENTEKQSVDFQVYGASDFALGDLCTYQNSVIGIEAEGRIVEITDIIEAGNIQKKILLGKEQVTITTLLKRR